MILQYSVVKIVMLTRTEERNPHNPSQLLVMIEREIMKFDLIVFLGKMLSLFSRKQR